VYKLRNRTILIRDIKRHREPLQPCVATIGNFDGCHLGHQDVIRQVVAKAKAQQRLASLVTFEPYPQLVLNKHQPLVRLTRLRSKYQILSELGIEQVILLRFNQALAKLLPQPFVEEYLVKKINIKHLVIGENFRFGYRQQGDLDLLRALGQQWQFDIDSIPITHADQHTICSTNIRQALKEGDLSLARKMLGRNFAIEARVVKGAQRGQKFGFPTLNIPIRENFALHGVFAVQVLVEQIRYNGVANVGNRPTVDGSQSFIEAHLFDFKQILYGKKVQIQFIEKIRDEKKFRDVDDLIKQIQKDIMLAKKILNTSTMSVI